MKTIKYLLQIFIIISFIGCQSDKVEVKENTTGVQNMVSNSPFSNLVLRVAQNPTSHDNIIDGSSCFSVQLPVTVIVNSQQITVASQSQYQLVLTAMNAFSNDDDLVNFIYPITIKFKNFSTRVVSNSNQLDDILEDCDEDNDLDEIDCLAIKYPITMNIYNTNNQIASTVSIQNNIQLFSFIINMTGNIVAAINYPISVINSSGQSITINNNTELQNIILASADDCDDDNIGGNGNPAFISIICSGSWKVSYFLNSNNDQTLNYTGYNFVFNANKACVAVKNAVSTNGKWSNSISSGKSKFKLKFDGSNLDELGKKWQVTEFTNTLIKLKSDDKKNDKFLYFTKN
ncbi:hypothetical protein [Flavobacterium sp.]|uniref:hypothetical protein n=1 Tax=Flavobacterium sp. TaxID=239 RepID=UPI00286AFE1A|nr:hypothetical protein [Flavobacterium sp.]